MPATDESPKGKKAQQHTILVLKGAEEFETWLNELADLAGLPVTYAVDQALRDYAVKLGHAPMPRRVFNKGYKKRHPAAPPATA